MSEFIPQPLESLRERLPEALRSIFQLSDRLTPPHSRKQLPAAHIFEFESGVQLVVTLERTPFIVAPDVAAYTPLAPGTIYLHVSASWADGYPQPPRS